MNWDQLLQQIQQIKSQNTTLKIQSVQSLTKIATSVSCEKVRDEILPLLYEFENTEQEVMEEIVNGMSIIGKYLFEEEGNFDALIPCYEIPLSYDQTAIAEQAIKSLEEVLSLSFDKNAQVFYLIKKLLSSDIKQSQLSAILIITQIFQYIPTKYHVDVKLILENQERKQNCQINSYLADGFSNYLYPNHVFKKLALDYLQKMLKSKFESVQMKALNSLLKAQFDSREFIKSVYSLIKYETNNKSWRVRYTIAKFLPKIFSKIDAFEYDETIQYCMYWLEDVEDEVIIKTLEIIPDIYNFLPKNILIEKLRILLHKNLFKTNLTIQLKTIEAIFSFLPSLHTDDIIRFYFPILLETIGRDDQLQISLRIFSLLPKLARLITVDKCEPLFEQLQKKLQANSNFKIREQYLTSFSKYILSNHKEMMNESSMKVIDFFLEDKVQSIRIQALKCIQDLADKITPDQLENIILKHLHIFRNQCSYQMKFNYYWGLLLISPFLSSYLIEREMKFFLEAVKSPYPNIRLIGFLGLGQLFVSKHEFTVKGVYLQALKMTKQDEYEYNREVASEIDEENLKNSTKSLLDNHPLLLQIIFQQ